MHRTLETSQLKGGMKPCWDHPPPSVCCGGWGRRASAGPSPTSSWLQPAPFSRRLSAFRKHCRAISGFLPHYPGPYIVCHLLSMARAHATTPNLFKSQFVIVPVPTDTLPPNLPGYMLLCELQQQAAAISDCKFLHPRLCLQIGLPCQASNLSVSRSVYFSEQINTGRFFFVISALHILSRG